MPNKTEYARGKQIATLLRPFWSIRARNIANRIFPHIPPDSHILDIGAGNGLIARELVKRGHRAVTLLDVIDWNISPLPLALFDGIHIPFPAKHFDIAILVDVIHHSQDEKTLVAEAARVAKSVLIVEETHERKWKNALATANPRKISFCFSTLVSQNLLYNYITFLRFLL